MISNPSIHVSLYDSITIHNHLSLHIIIGCVFLKVFCFCAALWIPRRVLFTLPVTQTCLGRSMEQHEARFLIELS